MDSESGPRKKSGTDTRAIIDSAREQFQHMTGRCVESVSAVRKSDDGWNVEVEVVELARIPDTTSVLGSYSVQVDGDGDVTGYERIRRYARGQTEI